MNLENEMQQSEKSLEPILVRQTTPTIENQLSTIGMEDQELKLKFDSVSQNVGTDRNQYKSKNFLEHSSNDEYGEELEAIVSETLPEDLLKKKILRRSSTYHEHMIRRKSFLGFGVSGLGLKDSRQKIEKEGLASQNQWNKKHGAGVKDYHHWRKMPINQQLMTVQFLSKIAQGEFDLDVTGFELKNIS